MGHAHVSPVTVGWVPRVPDPRVASVRIRCVLPMRALARMGCRSTLWAPGQRYDAVVFVKRYDAAAVELAASLRRQGTRVVVDLCDNPFFNPNALPAIDEMAVGVRAMASEGDVLVVSTEALGEVVRREVPGAPPLVVIGDALDESLDVVPPSVRDRLAGPLELARLRRWVDIQRAEGRVPLVWFGIHGGPQAPHGMADLESIRAVLEGAAWGVPVSLTVISNAQAKYRAQVAPWRIPTRYLEWRPTTFTDALALHDVAVLPVARNPFTMCKSSNRVVSALWAGVAVVADAIPSYREFSDCIVLDDWQRGLAAYCTSAERRQADVLAGRQRIDTAWRAEHVAAKWRALLCGDTASGGAATHVERAHA
jgi:hypothetical protein